MKHLLPNCKISIMLPTRARTTLLRRSIDSVIDTVSSVDSIEILLAVDDDDNETITYCNKNFLPYLLSKNVSTQVFTFNRVGYKNLHLYYNYLATVSSGEWLLLWNDDATMVDKDWDLEIKKYDNQFRLLRFKENHLDHPNALFPCVPRDWMMLFDMLSPVALVDSWISQVCYMNDIVTNINSSIFHDRYDITGNNNDEVAKQKENTISEGDPTNIDDMSHPSKIDLKVNWAHKVYWYLQKTNQGNDWFYKFVNDPNFDAFSKFKLADKNNQCFVE